MRRIISALTILTLTLAFALPAVAGDKGEQVTLKGWVTDEYCGKANANAKGKDCAIACAKKGAKLMLYSDEKLYKLPDQQEAMKHVGHEVVVTGILAEDGTLQDARFKKKDGDA